MHISESVAHPGWVDSCAAAGALQCHKDWYSEWELLEVKAENRAQTVTQR